MSLDGHNSTTSEISEIFRKSVSPGKDRAKKKTSPPFSLRLTTEERASLNEQAGSQPIGAYIRSRLFGDVMQKRRVFRRPSPDHQNWRLSCRNSGGRGWLPT